MTYKVVKFITQATDDPRFYRVAWCGEHYTHIIDVKLTGSNYLEFGADAAELYVMWLVLSFWEYAGQKRTARNLRLEVSRGAIKKLMRADSAKLVLNDLAYFGRTQFHGIKMDVEKKTPWADWSAASECTVMLDDKPIPRPTVAIPGLGDVSITLHALEEYAADTKGEIHPENIYSRIAERMREGLSDAVIPSNVERHKRRRHGGEVDRTRIMVDTHGWQYVLLQEGATYILKTIYNRGGAY